MSEVVERSAVNAPYLPRLHVSGAVVNIEALGGRIPIEYQPFDALPPTLKGDFCQPAHQRTADAMTARVGQYEEVFEKEHRSGEPRRIGAEEEGEAERAAFFFGEQTFERRIGAAHLPRDYSRGCAYFVELTLILGEAADHRYNGISVIGGGEPDATAGGHINSSDSLAAGLADPVVEYNAAASQTHVHTDSRTNPILASEGSDSLGGTLAALRPHALASEGYALRDELASTSARSFFMVAARARL
jgi:hypothetical protein